MLVIITLTRNEAHWCNLCRDLHSYLLGDQEENENSANQQVNNNQPARNNNAIPAGEGLHAAHQAILQQGGPVGFQPYRRPFNFPLRVSLYSLTCVH